MHNSTTQRNVVPFCEICFISNFAIVWKKCDFILPWDWFPIQIDLDVILHHVVYTSLSMSVELNLTSHGVYELWIRWIVYNWFSLLWIIIYDLIIPFFISVWSITTYSQKNSALLLNALIRSSRWGCILMKSRCLLAVPDRTTDISYIYMTANDLSIFIFIYICITFIHIFLEILRLWASVYSMLFCPSTS